MTWLLQTSLGLLFTPGQPYTFEDEIWPLAFPFWNQLNKTIVASAVGVLRNCTFPVFSRSLRHLIRQMQPTRLMSNTTTRKSPHIAFRSCSLSPSKFPHPVPRWRFEYRTTTFGCGSFPRYISCVTPCSSAQPNHRN